MKLSVVIPIYNAEKYIERCLNSILHQDIEDLEIICVDDGSTDNSLNILREYEKDHTNIFVYTQKNSYAGTARNFGMSKASGEYIHFLDVDDYILPNVYNPLIVFAEEKQADIIKFRSCAYDAASREVLPLPFSGYDLREVDQDLFGQVTNLEGNEHLFVNLTPVPWSNIVKASFLRKHNIRFNRLKCVNDRSFYIDILTHAKNLALYDNYIVMHKVNDKKSLSSNRRTFGNFECYIQSCQIIYSNVTGMSDKVKRCVLNNEFKIFAGDFSQMDYDLKRVYAQEIGEMVFEKYRPFLSEETLAEQYVLDLYAMAYKAGKELA